MKVKEGYDAWALQYDIDENKTRDLEAISLQAVLHNIPFNHCLEIGCGTGKNSRWLISRGKYVFAIDLSGSMLSIAKEKIQSNKVKFIQADINEKWDFVENEKFDLATFSLVLEHIENLDNIFKQLSECMYKNGYVYIGELHPFRQYKGSKARFEFKGSEQELTCYTHNLSDFIKASKENGFQLIDVNEYFDNDDRNKIPRILTLLMRKL